MERRAKECHPPPRWWATWSSFLIASSTLPGSGLAKVKKTWALENVRKWTRLENVRIKDVWKDQHRFWLKALTFFFLLHYVPKRRKEDFIWLSFGTLNGPTEEVADCGHHIAHFDFRFATTLKQHENPFLSSLHDWDAFWVVREKKWG